ncbi:MULTISPECIES: NUDIX hydrolase [Pseudomonas]|uniref:NUDIX domain-containing protein n=1 Tax=Pseudomonas quercus TaxID=2722792 RepID=A0ABX0YD78_9PSED|nr:MULTISPECIES: NUDIX domain-containing protein [Pseudomonas]MBF7142319.1 NUDIX domain-containing protein [Pseudomonas sp. LY10J]NJP00857.1 NUDIX domain-containing protein [Pseudomonas quercus]
MPNTLHIAAALLLNNEGHTLLVRKRGTAFFMQPGGKIEAHEQPVQALARELEEELGVRIQPSQATYLGASSAPAANEPGFQVHCTLFDVVIDTQVVPAAEIEEAVWVSAQQAQALCLAPLTRDWVLPQFFTERAS